jgi:hypothetical protein
LEDYESQYEEYKNKLLNEKWFRNKLTDLYRGSINAEEDYIGQNGVLCKVGLLGAVCGFLIAFTPVENGNWILGIFLFLGIIGSFVWAIHIGKKFAIKSGEVNFYSFEYDKYFKEHILEEKRIEMYEFEQDLSKIADYMQWYVDNPNNEPSEVMDKFCFASRRIGELKKKYQNISRYDSFARSLKNDYWFNAEIQENIDKYI